MISMKKKIMFLCHGNICRSPMAEYVMKDLVRKEGLENDYEITSGAVSDEEWGNPIYPPALRVLNENGIPSGNIAHIRFRPGNLMKQTLWLSWTGPICGDLPEL